MVTIKGYQQRKSAIGKAFLVLEIIGNLQIQKSQTGNQYATVNRCFIPCSFDEQTAQQLVGSTMPGEIKRIPCEPYKFTNPNTHESMTLDYKYVYVTPEAKAEAAKTNILKVIEAEVI